MDNSERAQVTSESEQTVRSEGAGGRLAKCDSEIHIEPSDNCAAALREAACRRCKATSSCWVTYVLTDEQMSKHVALRRSLSFEGNVQTKRRNKHAETGAVN